MGDDSRSETTTPGACCHASKRQPVVKLDVGGRTFKILRSTVYRFPDSLLAQMVDNFPEMLEAGESLYIDRNPRGFEWILEIYRKGNCRNDLPNMSAEALQDELDFYQLPSALDLGLDLHKNTKFSKEAYAIDLVEKIVSEIKICGLQNLFPWKVYVYFKCQGGKIDKMPNVFVEPPCGMDDMEYVAWRGHAEFMRVRKMEDDDEVCDRQRCGSKIRISPVEGVTEFLCKDSCPALMKFMRYAASKHDLDIKFGTEDTDFWNDEEKIEHLLIDCTK